MRVLIKISSWILPLIVWCCSCTPFQGIQGKVVWVTGNQMPGPEKKLPAPTPVLREIYIFEPTTSADAESAEGLFYDNLKTHLVAKAKSGKDGKFRIRLEPGKYSVFTKETQGLFANRFDSDGCLECVTVKPGETTQIVIQINYTAAY